MAAETSSVVFLTVDALRADHLSGHGYHRETSPNLDELITENLWFDTAYSASSHTAEAVPAILTGRYPDEAIDNKYRLDSPSIAQRLSEQGYATGAFHSNPYVSRAYGYNAGFDEFDDDLYFSQHRLLALFQRLLDILRNKHYARAEIINERSLAWLDSLDDGPFFLWNHYMDVHGPYEPPATYQEQFHGDLVDDRNLHRLYKRCVSDPDSVTEAEHAILEDLYDGEIRYTDDQITAFLDALAERGLLEDTIVIITGDHGDGFGEQGYYAHPRTLDDEVLHVPLAVLGLTDEPARISVPTSTLDIVPTVLSAIGEADSSLPGEPLQDIAADPDAYGDRCVFAQTRGDEGDTNGTLRRFRIHDGTDALTVERDIETNKLTVDTGTDSGLADILFDHSQNRIANHAQSGGNAGDVDTDGEVERRLKALGYK